MQANESVCDWTINHSSKEMKWIRIFPCKFCVNFALSKTGWWKSLANNMKKNSRAKFDSSVYQVIFQRKKQVSPNYTLTNICVSIWRRALWRTADLWNHTSNRASFSSAFYNRFFFRRRFETFHVRVRVYVCVCECIGMCLYCLFMTSANQQRQSGTLCVIIINSTFYVACGPSLTSQYIRIDCGVCTRIFFTLSPIVKH